jgi:hypothetical protein
MLAFAGSGTAGSSTITSTGGGNGFVSGGGVTSSGGRPDCSTTDSLIVVMPIGTSTRVSALAGRSADVEPVD